MHTGHRFTSPGRLKRGRVMSSRRTGNHSPKRSSGYTEEREEYESASTALTRAQHALEPPLLLVPDPREVTGVQNAPVLCGRSSADGADPERQAVEIMSFTRSLWARKHCRWTSSIGTWTRSIGHASWLSTPPPLSTISFLW